MDVKELGTEPAVKMDPDLCQQMVTHLAAEHPIVCQCKGQPGHERHANPEKAVHRCRHGSMWSHVETADVARAKARQRLLDLLDVLKDDPGALATVQARLEAIKQVPKGKG